MNAEASVIGIHIAAPPCARQECEPSQLRRLVHRVREDLERHDAGARCEILETHISIVLLAGDFAYKFKKPVDFGFLDFSTLERRRHFCEREVALNRRTAPDLYCGVVPVTLRYGGASLGLDGVPVEYAVKMRRFPDEARLDRLVDTQSVGVDDVRLLADSIAEFHAHARRAPGDSPFGSAALVSEQILGVFEPLRGVRGVAAIEAQTAQYLKRADAAITERKVRGFVRRCHGDLHLSNVASLGGRYVPFDCVEFSEPLSWIDTCSDIAFLVMDLDLRGEHKLANAFLNRYLETSGDYGATALLRLYLTYRTLVRAEVAQFALAGEGDRSAERRDRHLALAARYLTPRDAPALVITHGLSGSGKSHVSEALAMRNGFVHIRSDHERRRLAGLFHTARTGAAGGSGIYAPDHTDSTYARLRELAEIVVRAGFSVIIDATFLRQAQRQPFRELARRLGVTFYILDCKAPDSVLRDRIETRGRAGTDPSEATSDVLDRQIRVIEPLTGAEAGRAIEICKADLEKVLSGRLAQFGRACV